METLAEYGVNRARFVTSPGKNSADHSRRSILLIGGAFQLETSQTVPAGAPSYSREFAVGRLVAHTYGSGSSGDYYAYDVLGRPTLKFQQTGAVNHQLSAEYNLAGAVSSLTYPSGDTISNTFDQVGRLSVFSGNLGDGTTRTYSTGSVYSALGSLLREQFGPNTPVYHKLRYNAAAFVANE